MDVEYSPDEYEAELESLFRLIRAVHQRRMQKLQPMYFIEKIIRMRKVRLIKAADRNKKLKARLARFSELEQLKAQKIMKQLKFSSNEEKKKWMTRIETEVLNTKRALSISSDCISTEVPIKEEVNVKSEAFE